MHLKTAYFKIFNTRDINEKILYFYLCTFINNGRLHKLTHWKRLWCWEGLGAEGEGDNRGWDGWMASPTRRTWVWVNSGSWWWTGRPGMLQFIGSQRVGHDWVAELTVLELYIYIKIIFHDKLLQDIEYCSLCYIANRYCLLILCIVVCVCKSHTPNLSLSPFSFPSGRPNLFSASVCFCFI